MKKLNIIVTTMTLLVVLAQCKKEEQNVPINEGDTTAITLDIKNNGGTRMDVNTGTGEVFYEAGDVIYVASGGKYIGTLTHNGINFGGTITNPIVGEPLYFYFLGNITPTGTLTAGTTQSCSVVISDQTEHLPVIECAPSYETYNSGVTAYTAMLLNKCALVKFSVTTSSTAATCIMDFNNEVTVCFTNASFTYGKANDGNITLPAGSGEKWAILLPQEALEAGEVGSAYSADGAYTGSCGEVPAIAENGYLTIGIDVNVTTEVNPSEVPVGAINGLFTINANGDQVYFSQGNLQYIGSASIPYWKFADNQWDFLGDVQNGTSEYNNRDLFGWGTSGYNHGSVCYQPWSISLSFNGYYAYGDYNFNLFDQTGKADWGYNSISNGGNMENQWRTLTDTEWEYVFNSRSTASGIRYVKASVNGVYGVVLLPDNWSSSIYTLNNPNGGDYESNVISLEEWMGVLEVNGAVFLPGAGHRYSTSYVAGDDNFGSYWASTHYNTTHAYSIYFNSTEINISDVSGRFYGFAVRLVHDLE